MSQQGQAGGTVGDGTGTGGEEPPIQVGVGMVAEKVVVVVIAGSSVIGSSGTAVGIQRAVDRPARAEQHVLGLGVQPQVGRALGQQIDRGRGDGCFGGCILLRFIIAHVIITT